MILIKTDLIMVSVCLRIVPLVALQLSVNVADLEEYRLLECYAVWLL
jgi:hypothetical protein